MKSNQAPKIGSIKANITLIPISKYPHIPDKHCFLPTNSPHKFSDK
jgi:hypothetical protein